MFLAVVEHLGRAGPLFLVQRSIQAALLVSAANVANGLSCQRNDAGNAGRSTAVEYFLSVVVPEALGLGAGAAATAELLYRAPAEELA